MRFAKRLLPLAILSLISSAQAGTLIECGIAMNPYTPEYEMVQTNYRFYSDYYRLTGFKGVVGDKWEMQGPDGEWYTESSTFTASNEETDEGEFFRAENRHGTLGFQMNYVENKFLTLDVYKGSSLLKGRESFESRYFCVANFNKRK